MKESESYQFSQPTQFLPGEIVREEELLKYHFRGGVLFETVNPQTGRIELTHVESQPEQIADRFNQIIENIPAFRDNPLNNLQKPPRD